MEKKSAIYLFFVAFILLKGTYTYAQRQSNHSIENCVWSLDEKVSVFDFDEANIHKNGETTFAKDPEIEIFAPNCSESIDKVQSGQN